ncbi:hypothetical protein D3C77_505560 [compost metagenome]
MLKPVHTDMNIMQYRPDQYEHALNRQLAGLNHLHFLMHMHSLPRMSIQIDNYEMTFAYEKMKVHTIFYFLNLLFHRVNERAEQNRVITVRKAYR